MLLFEKDNFSWINENLEEKNVVDFGNAVFSKASIEKGELLVIFGGHVMSVEKELTLKPPLNDYSLQLHENFVIGPLYTEEIRPAEYFNHSCDPNAGINGQIFLVAMRNIAPNEQITFDYAMVLSESKERNESYSIRCDCKAVNCRGIITDKDWLSPELQKKYEGYFSWYIEQKIRKLKS